MKNLIYILVLSLFSCSSSSDSNNEMEEEMYFPPTNSSVWETKSLSDLNWNDTDLTELNTFLEENDTKGFIILHKGKIVVEEYYNGHDQTSNWYWASAGKTLASLTVGIAQEEGFLSINDKTSDYLGLNWTSLSSDKEALITIKNQLNMTTGMDDTIDCLTPNCLTYLADAGTRWSYHNAPYTLLDQVVTNAVGQDFENYFYEKVRDKIGMDGIWYFNNNVNVYYSTTRSMARFGLLILNEANWDGTAILNDVNYFTEMTNTSQNMNESYGYLWWLNGKDSFMLPTLQTQFQGAMIPDAPSDMIMALGKNDQKIYVIPSEDLVIVRMGESDDTSPVPISFDIDLWDKLNLLIR